MEDCDQESVKNPGNKFKLILGFLRKPWYFEIQKGTTPFYSFGDIQPKLISGVHDVIGIEMLLKSTQHIHFLFTDKTFHPGTHEPAHPMMVTG